MQFKTLIRGRYPLKYYRELIWRILRSFAVPLSFACSFILGIVAGLLATQLSFSSVVMLLVGVFAFFLSFSKPELIILLIMIASSSIIAPESIPSIYIGFNFTAIEMGLFLLFGIMIVRVLSGRAEYAFVHTPLDLPILLFFVFSAASFFNALYALGVHRGWLIPQLRIIFDYLIFFVVTNLVRSRRQLITLVIGMLTIAVVVATLTIMQSVLGSSVLILPGAGVMTAEAFEQSYEGVTRVSPPGGFLFSMMFIPSLVLLATPECFPEHKQLLFVSTMVLAVAIAITFSRSTWVGLTASLLLLFFMSPKGYRGRFLRIASAIIVVIGVSALFLNVYFPQVGSLVEALRGRLGTLFMGDEVVQSQEERLCEMRTSMEKFKAHPFLGVGPGGAVHDCEVWNSSRRFMHNSYLFILTALGSGGFLFFLWFSIVYLLRGFIFSYRLSPSVFREVIFGFTLSYIVALILSSAGGELMRLKAIVVLGVMFGVNEVAIRLGQQEALDQAVPPGSA